MLAQPKKLQREGIRRVTVNEAPPNIYLVSRIRLWKHWRAQRRRVAHEWLGTGPGVFVVNIISQLSHSRVCFVNDAGKKKCGRKPEDDSNICPSAAERQMETYHYENIRGILILSLNGYKKPQ